MDAFGAQPFSVLLFCMFAQPVHVLDMTRLAGDSCLMLSSPFIQSDVCTVYTEWYLQRTQQGSGLDSGTGKAWKLGHECDVRHEWAQGGSQ